MQKEELAENYPGREVDQMLYYKLETEMDQITCRSLCNNLVAGAYNWKDEWVTLGSLHSCRCYSRKSADNILASGLDQSDEGKKWLFCRKKGRSL